MSVINLRRCCQGLACGLCRLGALSLLFLSPVLGLASGYTGNEQADSSGPLRVLPWTEGGPVEVTARLHLVDITNIFDSEEMIEVQGVLTLQWRDSRQAFDPSVFGRGEKTFQGDFQFYEEFNGWYPQLSLVNRADAYETEGIILRIKPDGQLTLVSTLHATVKDDFELTTYPFDTQSLRVVFQVLGYTADEVELSWGGKADYAIVAEPISLPQWQLVGTTGYPERFETRMSGEVATVSRLVATVQLERKPLFMLRLVVLPMIVIVILSWSVFWMDKSSLGDRLSVSFVGILTAVTFQIFASDVLPAIAKPSWLNQLLNFSFILMSSTVLVNLAVGYADRLGNQAFGDRIDKFCRLAYPAVYFSVVASAAIVARFG